MEEEVNNNMDKNELKITALRQALGERMAEYEDRVADLRVEITLLTEQNTKLQEALQNAASQPLEGNVLLPED